MKTYALVGLVLVMGCGGAPFSAGELHAPGGDGGAETPDALAPAPAMLDASEAEAAPQGADSGAPGVDAGTPGVDAGVACGGCLTLEQGQIACVPGTADTLCGKGGVDCADCTHGYMLSCLSGACAQPPPSCGHCTTNAQCQQYCPVDPGTLACCNIGSGGCYETTQKTCP